MDASDVGDALEALLKEVNFEHIRSVQIDSETQVDHEVYVIPDAHVPPLIVANEGLTAGNQVVHVNTVSGDSHAVHVSSPCSVKALKETRMKSLAKREQVLLWPSSHRLWKASTQ